MLKVLLVSIGLVAPYNLYADNLTPAQLVSRCYSHLTGERLPLNSPYRKTPPTTEEQAFKVCDDIIDSAILETQTGYVKQHSTNTMGLKVLRNLYDFHRSWFGTDMFSGMQGSNPEHILGTTDNFDSTEAALFLTRATFAGPDNPHARYSSILQGQIGAHALREIDPEVNNRRSFPGNLLPSRFRADREAIPAMLLVKKPNVTFRRSDINTTTTMNVSDPVQVGELVGIKDDKRILILPNYNPFTERHNPVFSLGALNSQSAVADVNYVTGFNLYENQGGGILGLNSFIYLHWGLDPGVLQSGSLKMGRRWTEKIFNSLMCRQLPVLRVSDISMYKSSGDATDFRKSDSCLSCHSTMDQMAAVGRNILISGSDSDYSFATPAKFSHVIGRLKPGPSLGNVWPDRDVPNYHLTQPSGRVHYRTSDGTLVDRQVASFENVGAVLKESPDFYNCAAARYFELFTGIKMHLYDRGDPAHLSRVSTESALTKEVRAYLTSVTTDFRQHQNVRTVLKQLIRSKYYKDSNFGAGAP